MSYISDKYNEYCERCHENGVEPIDFAEWLETLG